MARKAKQEQEKQVKQQPKKTTNRKMSLKSASNSLKKIRKVVDDFIENGRELSPADKFDLKMATMYIDYLKESIDMLLSGKRPVVEEKNEDYLKNNSETDDANTDEEEDEEEDEE